MASNWSLNWSILVSTPHPHTTDGGEEFVTTKDTLTNTHAHTCTLIHTPHRCTHVHTPFSPVGASIPVPVQTLWA
jgi:hypothetical protein